MADAFDPYHKWLGIPPKDQPPHHYRLLGVDPFESDAEVIDAAANRQMAFVQACADGPHLRHSQMLLNEIAAARVCLLDPQRRAAYDAQLRERLPASAAGAAGPVEPPPVSAPPPPRRATRTPARTPPPRVKPGGSAAGGIVFPDEDAAPSSQALRRRQRTRVTGQLIIMLASLATLFAVAVLLILFVGGDESPRPDDGGDGASVNVPSDGDVIHAASLPGIVMDNNDSLQIGNVLTRAPAGERFVGIDYFVDDGSGNGDMTLRFSAPQKLRPGWYEVRISYVAGEDRASNLKVGVEGSNEVKVVTVDQRQEPEIDGMFHSLGRYQFDGSARNGILITNDGADGLVVVDAVQFLPAKAPE